MPSGKHRNSGKQRFVIIATGALGAGSWALGNRYWVLGDVLVLGIWNLEFGVWDLGFGFWDLESLPWLYFMIEPTQLSLHPSCPQSIFQAHL